MDALGWLTVGENIDRIACRIEADDENLVIYLTDLASLYCEHLNSVQIEKRCQELNPLVETTVNNLIQQLHTLICKSSDKWTVHFDQSNPSASLKLNTELDNFPFSWEFNLIRQNPDQFRVFVSLPLLAMLKEASSIEEELCSIIRNKDKQIDDYKASGAAVSRRHLETKEFNAEVFFAQHKWNTVEKSVRENPSTLFCQIIDRSKQLYAAILARVSLRRTPNLPDPEKLSKSAENIPIEKGTPKKSTSKESEADRSEAIRKRLREEERSALEKIAKKEKIKKIT